MALLGPQEMNPPPIHSLFCSSITALVEKNLWDMIYHTACLVLVPGTIYQALNTHYLVLTTSQKLFAVIILWHSCISWFVSNNSDSEQNSSNSFSLLIIEGIYVFVGYYKVVSFLQKPLQMRHIFCIVLPVVNSTIHLFCTIFLHVAYQAIWEKFLWQSPWFKMLKLSMTIQSKGWQR